MGEQPLFTGARAIAHRMMIAGYPITQEQEIYSSHPASDVVITYVATLAISSSDKRPPKAGMAFFPFLTCVMTAFSLRPPARY